jgi:hypothetical protein
MKRILSLLIILSIFAIGCFDSAWAFFNGVKKEENVQMNHHSTTVKTSNCCDSHTSDCDEYKHDCCLSPFKDSNNISSIQTSSSKDKKIKWKTLGNDFLAVIQESQSYNLSEKLNAPPYLENEDWKITNFYITLIGIIKNNA